MTRTVVVTGAAGNIGRKLCAHFAPLGWTLRLVDIVADEGVQAADLRDADL